jgi:hypothetical protein
MKNILQYGFTSFFIIMIAVCLYLAKDWNSATALFPRAVGFPMLVLMIVILARDIKNGRRRDKDGKTADDVEFIKKTGRMARYLAWLIGFIILTWAIGIDYTIPIYIFSYMKIEGKYGWLKCGIYAAATTAFTFILFEYVFRVAWPEGALFGILNL